MVSYSFTLSNAIAFIALFSVSSAYVLQNAIPGKVGALGPPLGHPTARIGGFGYGHPGFGFGGFAGGFAGVAAAVPAVGVPVPHPAPVPADLSKSYWNNAAHDGYYPYGFNNEHNSYTGRIPTHGFGHFG